MLYYSYLIVVLLKYKFTLKKNKCYEKDFSGNCSV